MPVSLVLTAWMTPAMSPSLISLTATPVVRSSSISPAWRGRSSTMAVISLSGTPLALANSVTLSVAEASMCTTPGA